MARRIRFIRALSFRDAVLLGVGFIVGSGIFIMPLLAAQKSGTFSLLAWAAAGFYCILTGLCFAECAALIPKVGGCIPTRTRCLATGGVSCAGTLSGPDTGLP